MPRMASLRKRLTDLIPELARFGVVGLIGSVIDLGGAAIGGLSGRTRAKQQLALPRFVQIRRVFPPR